MNKIEIKLKNLGFTKNTSSCWSRKYERVQIICSSEYPKMRVSWKEYWRDYFVLIFNYSPMGGPICVVPTKDFFNQPKISQKCKEEAYRNSGNSWSQLIEVQDPLPQLILSFENRWDVLGGERGEVEGWPNTPSQPKVIPERGKPVLEIPKPEVKSPLDGFINSYLLRLYCDLIQEFRKRGIIHNGNNVVADYGEKIVADKLNLKLQPGSYKGYDAIDEKTGLKYQVKARQLTQHNGASARQLGVIRDLENRPFDFLVAVIFDEIMEPKEILQIPIEVISKYSRFIKRINGHVLILAGDILQDETVKKLM
jgi:hypothetical protein